MTEPQSEMLKVVISLDMGEIKAVQEFLGKITMGQLETPNEATGLRKLWLSLTDRIKREEVTDAN